MRSECVLVCWCGSHTAIFICDFDLEIVRRECFSHFICFAITFTKKKNEIEIIGLIFICLRVVYVFVCWMRIDLKKHMRTVLSHIHVHAHWNVLI